jgi:GT2 family glycosyltransferase
MTNRRTNGGPPKASVVRATVVIPTWNGARFLDPCLTALDAQSLGGLASGTFETLVVDNGSTDDTAAILTRWPDVWVLRFPTNRGFAAAVNAGIRAARTDLVVLLNNDTEVEPGWLAALLGALRDHPEAGMATSKVRLFDRREILHTTGDCVDLAGRPSNRGVWEQDTGQWDAARDVFGANAAAAAYRRALFDDVGLFEEAFGSYMEDVDLAWRARLAGWTCVYVPEAVVYHHLSATGGGALASYLVARNRIWLIARNYPARLLLRNLGRVAAAQAGIARAALGAWRGEAARATLRGQLVGLVTWPRMLGARRRIQASRRVPDAAMERMLGG